MASQNIIAALSAKFASLTEANFPGAVRPAIYFDAAPPVNADGAQVSAESGYVVLTQEGERSVPLAFGQISNETVDVSWAIFYPSLGDCETTARVIRFNGGTAQQRAGLDHGTLPDLTAPPDLRDIVFLRQERGKEGIGKTGKLVHCIRVHHRICLTRSA